MIDQSKKPPTWPVTPAVRRLQYRQIPIVVPYIYAEAPPYDDAPAHSPTIAESIRLCEKAVAETWQACKEAGELQPHVQHSMRLTWLACLPPLDCLHNIRIYIALVSWAMVQRIISHTESKTYCYTAQVAMQARPRGSSDGE